MTIRIPCSACAPMSRPSKYCHECQGLGYIENSKRPADCNQEYPKCPIWFDPMVNGWECDRCGDSGPL